MENLRATAGAQLEQLVRRGSRGCRSHTHIHRHPCLRCPSGP